MTYKSWFLMLSLVCIEIDDNEIAAVILQELQQRHQKWLIGWLVAWLTVWLKVVPHRP